MPGFDGRGPAGKGPLTGWGRGVCSYLAGSGRGLFPAFRRPGRLAGWLRFALGLRRGGRGGGRRRWW